MSRLRITYKKSMIGCPRDQKETLRSLKLRKINQTVVRTDTPALRGMIVKVQHLVTVEEIGDENV